MANQWEGLIKGAIGGGLNFLQNDKIRRDNNKANDVYEKAKNQIFNDYADLNLQQANLLRTANNFVNPVPPQTVNVPNVGDVSLTPGTIDNMPVMKERMNSLYGNMTDNTIEAQRQLANIGGEYAKNNSAALERLYGNMTGQLKQGQPEQKVLETKDGVMIYDAKDPANTLRMVQPFNKEVKQKFGMPEGSFMKPDENGELSWYGIKQGTDGQVEEYKLGIKPTEQDIFNYNQSLTEPEKSGRIGRRGFSGKIPTQDISGADAYTQALLKKFAVLKSESNNNWDEFYFGKDKFGNIDKEKVSEKGREWDAIVRQLKTSLPGVDIDKLANDVFQGTFNKKTKKYDENALIQEERAKGKTYTDLLAWKNNIGNMWGRYSLDPNDANNNALLWLNEMDKHGWFSNPDVNIDSLRKFFKETTGRNLDDYVTIK